MASSVRSAPDRTAWLNAAILLWVSFFGVILLTVQVRPGSDVIAVVFPPWWNTERAISAAASADAALVRMTAIPSLLVLRPHQVRGLERLHRAGAWFAIDPQAIAACFSR